MWWDEDLKKLGFKHTGFWNNREYYEKNGFKIVEHYGFFRYDENNLSVYGDEIEIEQLDKEYKKWYTLLNYTNPKTTNPLNLEIFYNSDILIYFLIGLIDGDGSIWRSRYTNTSKGSISIRIELHPTWENVLIELFNKIEIFYKIKFNIKNLVKVI